jgi:hypothetical protein
MANENTLLHTPVKEVRYQDNEMAPNPTLSLSISLLIQYPVINNIKSYQYFTMFN